MGGVGGSIERRWFGDRVAVGLDATHWIRATRSTSFNSVAASAKIASSADARRWIAKGAAGIQRVSDTAPIGLWPGAGEGQARGPLLRAHPLIDDGAMEIESAAVFGRSLVAGSVEGQRR